MSMLLLQREMKQISLETDPSLPGLEEVVL